MTWVELIIPGFVYVINMTNNGMNQECYLFQIQDRNVTWVYPGG